jgi:ABC-type tungstate transport system permease subunit
VGADLQTLATALGALCVLMLVMRWTFKPSRPRYGRPVDAAESTDLGMLDVVAADLSRADAMLVRARLGDAGIRTSLSRRRNGDVDVLVFHDDTARARALLGG